MTITIDLIVAALMVISVLVAVFIGFHRVMIVRSFLRADQRGGHVIARAVNASRAGFQKY